MLNQNEWMNPETKEYALKKVNTINYFQVKSRNILGSRNAGFNWFPRYGTE
jgi:hypothetical protein